jgi:hypothetical protein
LCSRVRDLEKAFAEQKEASKKKNRRTEEFLILERLLLNRRLQKRTFLIF